MPPKKSSKSKIPKKPIPEDFELSDEEPAVVNLNEEQKLSSKNIVFECPLCNGKLQMRNEIEINPKGIKCKCSPCSFKISKNDKTMNVKKDHDGEMVFEREDHSINFSFNRQITPEDKNKESTNKMISDVIGTPRSAGGSKGPTPTSKKKQVSINDMD
jgi:hypothetical protein